MESSLRECPQLSPELSRKGGSVAQTITDRLVPMFTDVTPANERIMGLKISHTVDDIFLVSVYAPTRVSEFSVKETLYAQFQMVSTRVSRGYLYRPG